MIEIAISLLLIWVVYRFWKRRTLRHQLQQESSIETYFTMETNIYSEETESLPHAYASWHEALNRPVTDRLLFWIEYADRNGVMTERTIIPTGIQIIPKQSDIIIKAHCNLRDNERSFYSQRILQAKNLLTQRPIKDLGSYLRNKY